MNDNNVNNKRAGGILVAPGGRSSALLVYTLSHAAVDLACGYTLYYMWSKGVMHTSDAVALFLLYNTLAFGLQFILGAVCDRFGGCRATAVTGCILTAVGTVCGGYSTWLAVVLVGVGNAAFHTGGGCDTLRHTDGMAGSGIFVSSGALGLAIGIRLGTSGKLPGYIIAAMLLFAAAAIALFCGELNADGTPVPLRCMPPVDPDRRNDRRMPIMRDAAGAVIVCLFAILVRSYTGFIAPSPGFSGRFAFIYVAFCAFAGKFAGGIMADLIGARRVGILSLMLSIPLFWIGAGKGIFFLAAIFLFNFAMPITLCTVARRLPGHEGFAFGLNTLALLIGYIAAYFPVSVGAAKLLTAVLTALAAVAVSLSVSDERPADFPPAGKDE